jgi:transposase, IS5 family
VNRHLASRGLRVAGGTIVDATIIAAPSSTKNADRARDPEMRQTRKGQQWGRQQDQADPLDDDDGGQFA